MKPSDYLIAEWVKRVKMLREALAVQEKSERLLVYCGSPPDVKDQKYCLALNLARIGRDMVLKAERDFAKALRKEYGARWRVDRHAPDRWTIRVRAPGDMTGEHDAEISLTKTLKVKPAHSKPRPATPTTFKEAVLAARSKHYPKA